MLFNFYSDRTQCPECHKRVRLEDVKFTPKFSCPHCGKEICVASRVFERVTAWLAWSIGLAVSWELTQTWWMALVLWVPCTWGIGFVLTFLWSYAGKYFFPPHLKPYVAPKDCSSVLGLDSE